MLSTACALRATSARARTHLRAVAVARDPAGQSAAPAAAEPGPPSVRRVARLARAGEHQMLLGPKVAQLERHVRRRGQTILIAGEHCKLVADRARGHRGTKSGTLVEVERPRPAQSRQLTLVRRTLHWPARRWRANGAPAAPRFDGPPTSSADCEQVTGVGASEEQRCVHHGGGCHGSSPAAGELLHCPPQRTVPPVGIPSKYIQSVDPPGQGERSCAKARCTTV